MPNGKAKPLMVFTLHLYLHLKTHVKLHLYLYYTRKIGFAQWGKNSRNYRHG